MRNAPRTEVPTDRQPVYSNKKAAASNIAALGMISFTVYAGRRAARLHVFVRIKKSNRRGGRAANIKTFGFGSEFAASA